MTTDVRPYALITGASSGIGFQYARVLAEKGYNIVIVSNVPDELAEKAGMLKKEFPVDVVPLVMDLGRQEAAMELYDACRTRNLEVEVLVNNAGVYHGHDFIDDSVQFNELILNLHVFTPAMSTYYFARDMAGRHKGYILNMSSITASMPVQTLAAYGATKRFLLNFSRSLHTELHAKGVTVTAVCPGAVATNLYHLDERHVNAGLKSGLIITPEKLARRGVKAMFKGRVRFTPGWFNRVGAAVVGAIPVGMLRMIRRRGWY